PLFSVIPDASKASDPGPRLRSGDAGSAGSRLSGFALGRDVEGWVDCEVVGAGVRSRHQCNAVLLTPSIQIIVMAASRGSANRPPSDHGCDHERAEA
ncbi:MAG: hypothetical protein ACK6A4_03590, partial [Alphaproteobacteria bacterium]